MIVSMTIGGVFFFGGGNQSSPVRPSQSKRNDGYGYINNFVSRGI